MTRRLAVLVAVAAMVAAGGLAVLGPPSSPIQPGATPDPGLVAQPARIANRAPGGDANRIEAIPSVRLAGVVAASRVYDAPGGAELRDDDGNALTIEVGFGLAVFEGPRLVAGEAWFRVYALPNANAGPTDYFGWLPLHGPTGAETIGFKDPPACPDGRGISALGALDPFTRASCLGAASLTVRGWTWDRMLPTWYRITPEWLGEQNGKVDSTISLNESRLHRGAQGGGPFPFVELQVPPGLEVPPFEFQIEVAAHVADPLSGACVRTSGEFSLVPDDDPRNGPLWCATRLVIERWTPLLGPEERAIDPAAPQLHRHPEAGPNFGCAGVGMPPLVFRIDPTQLDPVWLEVAAGGNDGRIIPNFDPGFRAAFAPGLVIVDERGQVVAQNGTPVNPDGQLAGHFICPTGRVVYFD